MRSGSRGKRKVTWPGLKSQPLLEVKFSRPHITKTMEAQQVKVLTASQKISHQYNKDYRAKKLKS